MSLGCAMIVRDGAATIELTIASVRAHVDQVAVWVDDRTADDTLAILERLRAQHETPLSFATGTFEWFAQARNASFDLVDPEHEWIVWLDDDVVIGGENLRALTAAASELGANWIAADYDYADLPDGPKILSRPRVARRSGAQWEGAIHEDLVPVPSSSSPVVSAVRPGDLCVRHLRRDVRLGHYLDELLAATEDLDRTPHAYLYLGTEYMRLERQRDAQAAFRRYITERHDRRGDRRCVWARLAALTQLANAHEQLGEPQLAAGIRAQAQAEQRAEETRLTKLRQARLDAPERSEPTGGRNDPCWCGSGKKLKRCHGSEQRRTGL